MNIFQLILAIEYIEIDDFWQFCEYLSIVRYVFFIRIINSKITLLLKASFSNFVGFNVHVSTCKVIFSKKFA